MKARRGPTKSTAACCLIACLAIATVSACGSSSKKTSPNTNPTSAGKSATGTPIRVLVVAPEDTQIQNFPESQGAAKSAALALNSRGGINGHPVQVDFCNEGVDPNQDVACARKAADNKDVAIIGSIFLGGGSYESVVESEKIPMIGNILVNLPEFSSPMSFPLGGGTLADFAGAVDAAKIAGYTKIATATVDRASGKNAAGFVKQAVTAGGLTYAGDVSVPTATTDYAPIVASLKATGAEAIICITTGPTVKLIAKAMPSAGLDAALIFSGGALSGDDLQGNPLGAASAKAEATQAFPPPTVDKPEIKRYNTELDAGEKAGIKGADKRNGNSIQAWLAIQAIDKIGSTVTGELTNASLLDALNSAKDIDLGGIIPAWTPSKKGPLDLIARVSNPTSYIAKIDGDNYVLVKPDPVNAFIDLGLAKG